MVNQSPLIGEAIDNDEIRTGKRRETTYSGVNALITKPAVSIGHSLLLGIIGLFGYQQGVKVSDQPATVATGVLIALTIVPIICISIAVIALHFNPLEGRDWQAKKRHLQEIPMQKEKDYVESLKKKESSGLFLNFLQILIYSSKVLARSNLIIFKSLTYSSNPTRTTKILKIIIYRNIFLLLLTIISFIIFFTQA